MAKNPATTDVVEDSAAVLDGGVVTADAGNGNEPPKPPTKPPTDDNPSVVAPAAETEAVTAEAVVEEESAPHPAHAWLDVLEADLASIPAVLFSRLKHIVENIRETL